MINPVRGVYLDHADAEYVAQALEEFARVLAEQRSQPTARLRMVTTRLRKSVAKSGVSVSDNASESWSNLGNSGPNARNYASSIAGQSDSVHDSGHANVTTGEAARILGISANGVRDLARRGRLPAERSGGRWVYPTNAVVLRADAIAARRADAAARRAG